MKAVAALVVLLAAAPPVWAQSPKHPNKMTVFEVPLQGTFRVVSSLGSYSFDPLGFAAPAGENPQLYHQMIQTPAGKWLAVPLESGEIKHAHHVPIYGVVFLLFQRRIYAYDVKDTASDDFRDHFLLVYTGESDEEITERIVGGKYFEVRHSFKSRFVGFVSYRPQDIDRMWHLSWYHHQNQKLPDPGPIQAVKTRKHIAELYLSSPGQEFTKVYFNTASGKFTDAATLKALTP